MGQEAPADSVRTVDDLDWVVDADGHVQEDLDDVLDYMDDRYSGAKRIISDCGHPMIDIFSLSHSGPVFIHADFYGSEGMDFSGHGGENIFAKKIKEMADFDITASVLNPSLGLGIATINNDRYAAAYANGYNSWLLDFIDGEETLKGALLVAPQAPDRGAEEIDEHGDEDDVVAVCLPAPGGPFPPGHRWYDPIYEAAEANDLPILFHGGTFSLGHAFADQHKGSQTFAEGHTVAHPFAIMWSLTSVMYQGVPERFPDLEMVFQEAGLGWVPYMRTRLDDQYLEMADELPLLNRPPTEYIDENFYFTTQPVGHAPDNPDYLARMIELAGPETIMFAADLPHPDFDTPEELFTKIRSHFDAETLRNIMGGTAADLFDLR